MSTLETTKPKESTYIRVDKAKPTGHNADNMNRREVRKAKYFRPLPSNELPHPVVDHIVLIAMAALAFLKQLQLGGLRPDDEPHLGHLLDWTLASNPEGEYKNYDILVFPNTFLNKEFGRLCRGSVWKTRWEHFRGSKGKGKRTTTKSALLRAAVADKPEATKYVPDLTAEQSQHPAACLINLTVRNMIQRMEQYNLKRQGGKKASARKRAHDDEVPSTPEALVTAAPLPTAGEVPAKRRRPTTIAAVEKATAKPGSRLIRASLKETSPEKDISESELQELFGQYYLTAEEIIEWLAPQGDENKEPEAGLRKDDCLLLTPEGPVEVEDLGDYLEKGMVHINDLLDAPNDLGQFHLKEL